MSNNRNSHFQNIELIDNVEELDQITKNTYEKLKIDLKRMKEFEKNFKKIKKQLSKSRLRQPKVDSKLYGVFENREL